MFESDCVKCRKEVTRRTRWLSCEKRVDWFHFSCVGLAQVSERILECKNLVNLCDKCLPEAKKGWKSVLENKLESTKT